MGACCALLATWRRCAFFCLAGEWSAWSCEIQVGLLASPHLKNVRRLVDGFVLVGANRANAVDIAGVDGAAAAAAAAAETTAEKEVRGSRGEGRSFSLRPLPLFYRSRRMDAFLRLLLVPIGLD